VKRLGDFLEEILSSHLSGNILISTHAIAMKGALEYLTPKSHGSYWTKYIGNCAVYRTAPTSGGYLVPELWLSGV
jgi:broad specificity phosphatase PhoE